MTDRTPESDANAAGDYLAALINRGVSMENAMRLTVAYILSRGTAKGVEDAVQKLGDVEEKKPWE